MNLVETIAEGLVRKCEGKLEPKELDDRVGEKIAEVIPTMTLPGFRKGKVPERVIRARFAKELRGETINSIIEDALRRHLEETGNNPVRPPETNVTGVDTADEDIVVTIDYECMPDMPEIDYSEIKLERPVPKDIESMVDRDIQSIASMMAAFSDTEPDYEAGLHDQVTYDLKVRVDGVEREDLQQDDMVQQVEVSDSTHPFAGKLAGVKVGDTRVISGELPESLMKGDGSRSAEFECLVKKIGRAELPEVDDEMVKRIGVDSLEKFRNVRRQRFQDMYATQAESIMHQRLLDELDSRLDFELPPGLLAGEINSVRSALASEKAVSGEVAGGDSSSENLIESGETAEVSGVASSNEQPPATGTAQPESESEEEVERIARRRLKLGLYLADVAKTNELKVTNADYEELIASQVRNPEDRQRAAEAFKNNPDLAKRWLGTIVEKKALRYLSELTTRVDEEMDEAELARKVRELSSDMEDKS